MIAKTQHEANELCAQAKEACTDAGMVCHEDFAGEDFEFLGHWFSGSIGRIQLSSGRRCKLQQAIIHIVKQRKITGYQLRIVLGHLSWSCLLYRCLLSAFCNVYKFAEIAKQKQLRVWQGVIRELVIIRDLLPLCRNVLHLPVSRVVYVSDACGSGYAVGSCDMSLTQVRRISATDDRWRYSGDCDLDPRTFALTQEHVISHERWSHGFTLLSKHDIDEHKWKVEFQAPYKFQEPIHIKEIRGIVAVVGRLTRCTRYPNHFHLAFGDNLGVCLALQKGRCHDPTMLQQCRRVCSYLIASNCKFLCRWLPSEWNVVDLASRFCEPGFSIAASSSHVRQAQPRSRRRREPVEAGRHEAGGLHAHSSHAPSSPRQQPRCCPVLRHSCSEPLLREWWQDCCHQF